MTEVRDYFSARSRFREHGIRVRKNKNKLHEKTELDYVC